MEQDSKWRSRETETGGKVEQSAFMNLTKHIIAVIGSYHGYDPFNYSIEFCFRVAAFLGIICEKKAFCLGE